MPISFDKHNLFQFFPKFAPPYIPDSIAISIPKPIVEYEYTLKPLIVPSIIPATIMTVTPAAVEEFFNVYSSIFIDVPRGCCNSISIRNISNIPVNVQNANLIIERVA